MYLRYVVPSEMPSSYEKEALKAQAVCARTYACARIREKTWENYHADVDDSVESQVYHNMEAQPETDAAVAETEGKNHHLRRGTNSGVFFLNLLREDEYG